MDGSSEDASNTAAAASSLEGQAHWETLGKVNEKRQTLRCMIGGIWQWPIAGVGWDSHLRDQRETNRRVDNAGHSTSPACCPIYPGTVLSLSLH